MGIKLFSGSDDDECYMDKVQRKFTEWKFGSDPIPTKFKIINIQEVRNNLVVMMEYSNCTNYEGYKLLVYVNVAREELIEAKVVDPHFSDNKTALSPFARFEPTDEGWDAAILLAEHI